VPFDCLAFPKIGKIEKNWQKSPKKKIREKQGETPDYQRRSSCHYLHHNQPALTRF
jgi:hypothetical protein